MGFRELELTSSELGELFVCLCQEHPSPLHRHALQTRIYQYKEPVLPCGNQFVLASVTPSQDPQNPHSINKAINPGFLMPFGLVSKTEVQLHAKGQGHLFQHELSRFFRAWRSLCVAMQGILSLFSSETGTYQCKELILSPWQVDCDRPLSQDPRSANGINEVGVPALVISHWDAAVCKAFVRAQLDVWQDGS